MSRTIGVDVAFWWHVQVFKTFGLDNENPFVRKLYKEVRVVIGDITIGVHIIQLEVHCHIILGVGNHIGAVF